MARPKKTGLDYFPVDVSFDEKIESIEMLHGNNGLVWILKFWQSAYKTEIGEVNFNGLFAELHANNCRITIEEHEKILKNAISVGFCYETEHGFYTSNGIKKRIGSVSKERSDAILRQEERKNQIKKKIKNSKVKETPHYSMNNLTDLNINTNTTFSIPCHLSKIWPYYLEMRKLIKKPATENAQISIIAKLEKLAPNDFEKQISIIQQSIDNSWQGVFELKNINSTTIQPVERCRLL